jgi:hypothetical protein
MSQLLPELSSFALPDNIPEVLRYPKFSIGQHVVWAYVDAHDYGSVIGKIWTTESTCQTPPTWHYLIALAPTSLSYSFCKQDWACEEALKLYSEFNNEQVSLEQTGS